MTDSDELHKLSETVYRHLEKSFSPGLRNIIATGKAYHESLNGVNAHAMSYIEALLKVGHGCKTTCKGSTQALGEALFAIADMYRQIQAQIEEANKALWTEFLLPLETKVESQFREIVQSHKRYTQGHKAVYGSFEKAENTLKKTRKKSKSKRGLDDHQEVESLKGWNEKLTKFRSQGLKIALVEERKHYCYLLDKCCSTAKINSDNYFRAGSLLGRPLATWQALCEDPLTLPPDSASLVAVHAGGNVSMSPLHNGHVVMSTKNLEYAKHLATHPYISTSPDHILTETQEERGEYDMNMVTALPPTARSPHVRATYNHAGDAENQLSFNEGDVIVLIGEKSEGWHYGMSTKTNRYGWFPLSFVEAVEKGVVDTGPPPGGRQRHRSVGDIRETVPSDPLHDPGHMRRPYSMYGNPPLARHAEHPSHVMQWLESVNGPARRHADTMGEYIYGGSDGFGGPMYAQYSSLPASYRANQPEVNGATYANESYHANQKHVDDNNGYHSVPPSPPLPPPPIPSTLPPPPNVQRSTNITNPRSGAAATKNNYSSPLHIPPRSSMSQPLPPPPPLPVKHHPHHHHYHRDVHFDTTLQSGDNTGSDTYQEAIVGPYGDGKPDFWMRGIHNNTLSNTLSNSNNSGGGGRNGHNIPHADYDDEVPGYRGRASHR